MDQSEKKEKNVRLSAGFFLIAGLFLMGVFIFTISKERGLTQSKFQVMVYFNNVGGLLEGAPIQLSGVVVGNVDTIDFLDKEVEGRRVRVSANIFNKYRKQFNADAKFYIRSSGILGEKLLEVKIIEGGKVIDLTQPILGENYVDVQDLTDVFAKAAESFTKTSEQLSKIEVEDLAESLRHGISSLEQTSQGMNRVLGELRYIAIKSKRLMDRVEKKLIEGNLFKVF